MIIISACLCGVNCKYNGKNNLNSDALGIFKKGYGVLVCPEQLGGQSTPRGAHEIVGGGGRDVLEGRARVLGPEGDDATGAFIKGAFETLKIAKECGAEFALLKSRSPSCGFGQIYDGTFSSQKIKGNGVAAELLKNNDIEIFTEENVEKLNCKLFK